MALLREFFGPEWRFIGRRRRAGRGETGDGRSGC
jgi:hypothetical protein